MLLLLLLKWDIARIPETMGHGFMVGDEQKQVEATMCYFRDEVKSDEASSSFSLSWVLQLREVSTTS